MFSLQQAFGLAVRHRIGLRIKGLHRGQWNDEWNDKGITYVIYHSTGK